MIAPEIYMEKVLHLASEALDNGEFPIAAMVVLDGEILSQAVTSEVREKRFLVHAELIALELADKLQLTYKQRIRAVLYTNLEPCLMCMGAAMSFFLGEIVYGLESPGDGALEMKMICRVIGFQKSQVESCGKKAAVFSRNMFTDMNPVPCEIGLELW